MAIAPIKLKAISHVFVALKLERIIALLASILRPMRVKWLGAKTSAAFLMANNIL